MEDNSSSEKKIKQYFTSDAWTALSEYEKRRYENVQRNYEFLKASGITPKMPEFMMTKYNHSNSKNQMKINSNMPKGNGMKKAKFKLFAVPKKPSTKNKNLDRGVNVDIAFTVTKESSRAKKETTAMISLRNLSPKEFAQTLILSAQNALEKLEEMIGDKEVLSSYSAVEEDLAPKQRYPKRSVERKCYTEEDISSEDESLHCDICDEDYKGACPLHGPMLLVCDTKVHKNDSQKAKNTLPYFLSIGISSLPKAGLGVWTEMPLTAGMVFGPYKGSLIKKTMEAKKSGYAWLVRKGLKVSHYVEGRDEGCSNWLRYVNCAYREERQNVVAFQYQGDIYYRTYKPVLPFTEILVWYGDGYASELGIDLQQEKDVECPKEIVGFRCDVCNMLFSSSRALERHRRKHPSMRTDLRHQCPECSYSTDRKSNILKHMLTHSGEKPHACPQCHKRFAREDHLRRHLVLHTGEKKHVCDTCSQKFNQKYHLVTHERLHSGEKPYRCPDCGRDFNLATTLKSHLKTHTGQRPHRCPHCEYRGTQPSNLSKHIVYKHTKQFPHSCTFCQKGFCVPSEVRKHIVRHHSNAITQ